MLLLHHAAAQGYQDVRPAPFYPLKRPDIPKHPVLGVLAHRAGVKQNQIGLFRLLGKAEPHLRKHPLNPLGIRDVLLAAESAHMSERSLYIPARAGGEKGAYPVYIPGIEDIGRSLCVFHQLSLSFRVRQVFTQNTAQRRILISLYYTKKCGFFQPCAALAERPKTRHGFIVPGFAGIYIKKCPGKNRSTFLKNCQFSSLMEAKHSLQ
jgi:hypothetical protein